MKLLYVTRFDAFRHRGGDTVQLEALASTVGALGHEVTIRLGVDLEPLDCDIAHVFNLQRVGETARQANRLLGQVPTVLSPIYGDTSKLDREGRGRLTGALHRAVPEWPRELAKHVSRARHGVAEVGSVLPLITATPRSLRRRVLLGCDAVLPNSRWESDFLSTIVGSKAMTTYVIPNGVDGNLRETGESAAWFREQWGVTHERFVLSVARFDHRKNNLGLIKGLLEAGVPAVLIGQPAPLHQSYYRECLREAARSGKIQIISEALSHRSLAGAYKAAWVHALPSWLETPGLVSLEAALCGANLVLGESPPVREYFGDKGWYCNPGDVSTIAVALRGAIDAERNALDLQQHVESSFTWQQIARLQLDVYERVLGDATDVTSRPIEGSPSRGVT